MKPPKQNNVEYEKVPTDDFVKAEIEDIAYDQEHLFKGFNGEADKKRPAVRLRFKVEGCKFSHYSRWMSFSYGEKATLFTKYLVPLVEDAQPDMDFDLDGLKGMKIKILWAEKNGFQFPETIRPIGSKLKNGLPEIQMGSNDLEPDEEVPF